jgi:sugar/nucleoside kinase (ribokinase family)
MEKRFDLFVIGRLFCDLIFTGLDRMPELGREHFAPGLSILAGGGAFITSAWLRALDIEPALVSDLGSDPFSAEVAQAIAAQGLDSRFVRRHAEPLPQVTVAMPVRQDRAFLTHLAPPGASRDLRRGLEQAIAAGHGAWLHVCELATLVTHPELVELARAHGARLSLDPSWDERLMRDPDARALIEKVDLFLPNDAEALAITGAETVEAALDELAEAIPAVIVKCGDQGAIARKGSTRLSQGACRAPELVDTTGAGDAFNAGLIASMIRGESLAGALRAGAECGAQAVGIVGGVPPEKVLA